jgi:hypothetical protein
MILSLPFCPVLEVSRLYNILKEKYNANTEMPEFERFFKYLENTYQ